MPHVPVTTSPSAPESHETGPGGEFLLIGQSITPVKLEDDADVLDYARALFTPEVYEDIRRESWMRFMEEGA